MEKKIEAMLVVLYKTYDELSKLPKPHRYEIGGTYYGATQLFSSVGNHLEMVENCNHTSYESYGINTNYKDAFIIRIGGAYKFSTAQMVTELVGILGGRYDKNSNIGIITDYGTNYSVIGFGTVVR